MAEIAHPTPLNPTELFTKIAGKVRRRLGRIRRAITGVSDAAPPPPVPSLADMPQAQIVDHKTQRLEKHDWRTYFSSQLSGRGLEIGPLHRPIPTHPGMKIDYVDRYSVPQLRACYPELRELPLVDVNIIDDAESLKTIPPASYDFVVSAHVIEHMKNPLGAIENWCRTLKPGGKIYLIVPDKRVTFDKKRVRTTLEHIILDYRRPSSERDFEHCLEYSLHVHNEHGDTAIAGADNIITTDYSIHYHTFIPEDVVNLLTWFSENIRPLRILEGPVQSPGSDEFHLMLQVA